ncbi:MAG: AAA family ATPase, partial [Rhodospirillales bacterium]|nr:AAA family ATPase [Rhodospirillales bacterium]
AARQQRGFVRRAHGDLHLGNMCLWQGRPVAFDALEFDEDLATIDLGYDLAFLLMELDRRPGRAAANRVFNRYVALRGDHGLACGLPLFLSLRAMIRAHVEAARGHPREAAAYLDAALAHLAPAPAVVVAIGGLPGTGKSTLARALAPLLGPAPGALILRSDAIRKRRHGVAPETRLPAAAYAPAASAAVFEEMMQGAAEVAGAGHAVIADATFLEAAHQAAIRRAAGAVRFLGVWLRAPMAALEARVEARSGDASDADLAVLRRAAPADRGAAGWLAVDASDAAAALAAVRAALAAAPC